MGAFSTSTPAINSKAAVPAWFSEAKTAKPPATPAAPPSPRARQRDQVESGSEDPSSTSAHGPAVHRAASWRHRRGGSCGCSSKAALRAACHELSLRAKSVDCALRPSLRCRLPRVPVAVTATVTASKRGGRTLILDIIRDGAARKTGHAPGAPRARHVPRGQETPREIR